MTKLTVGMATIGDYHGAYFTVQALRVYHAMEVAGALEILIVDNDPDTKHGEMVKSLCDWTGAKYVPMHDPVGTSVARNRVFDEASGDFVMCMDCHVLLVPGAIKRLLEYISKFPDCEDLLCGPLLLDNLTTVNTHFNDQWRAEMRGTWGVAWRCGCDAEKGVRFSTIEIGEKAKLVLLAEGQIPITSCANCSKKLPQLLPWNGHDQKLMQDYGCQPIIDSADCAPFEIPAQGLGLFVSKRDKWLRFNDDCRGFGGEECYIHSKYRMAGRRTMLLPFLGWVHRFGRPEGAPYPLSRWDRVRNYALEYLELGQQGELERAAHHFIHEVQGNGITEETWEYLLEDPLEHTDPPNTPEEEGCTGCNGQQAVPKTLRQALDVFEHLKGIERDLNSHMDTLRRFSAKCDHVTEISHRRESHVALACGQPKVFQSYNVESDAVYNQLGGLNTKINWIRKTSKQIGPKSFAETDLLFLDTKHTADWLAWELKTFGPKVRKYIVLHDTELYGERGEDGGPGLLPALRHWLQLNPEWRVLEHHQKQYGLTVLSKVDAPKLPTTGQMAWNFTVALAKFAKSGGEVADKERSELRLSTCALCPMRVEERCSKCGCFLVNGVGGVPGRALMADMPCPLGFWAEAERLGKPIVPLVVSEDE